MNTSRPAAELGETAGATNATEAATAQLPPAQVASAGSEPGWERGVLERLALEALREQRRNRRWSVFFRLAWLICFLLLLAALGDWGAVDRFGEAGRHTALVQIQGAIEARGEGSAERIIGALQAAFEDKGTQGVILAINSPGGSPVQAGMINDEIYRLRKLYPDIPLYAVVEDYCASGGYYVAVAADRIFVDKASMVGSIGVLMEGFGFTGSLDKLGIERRLLTSGQNKGFLDPFLPQDPQQKIHAMQMLDEIHQQFIEVVRKGRGARLKEQDGELLFSGLMWSGARSIELGLADAYGTVDTVAREVIKAGDIRDYTIKQGFAERFSSRFGASMADGAAERVAIRLERLGWR